jgi:type VI secretion system secreted protein VgrG
VRITAQKELTLESGGAFIQIKDGSITLGGPADLFIKTITIQKQGKASINTPMPSLPRAAPAVTDLEFRHVYPDGSPVVGCRYVATLDNKKQQRGMLDADGYTRLSGLSAGIGGRIQYLDDPNPHSSIHTVAVDDDLAELVPSTGRKV